MNSRPQPKLKRSRVCSQSTEEASMGGESASRVFMILRAAKPSMPFPPFPPNIFAA